MDRLLGDPERLGDLDPVPPLIDCGLYRRRFEPVRQSAQRHHCGERFDRVARVCQVTGEVVTSSVLGSGTSVWSRTKTGQYLTAPIWTPLGSTRFRHARNLCMRFQALRLEPGVDWFGFEGEDAEDAFVDSVQWLASHETLEGLDAEAELAYGEAPLVPDRTLAQARQLLG